MFFWQIRLKDGFQIINSSKSEISAGKFLSAKEIIKERR
jgi:hypothetical protein